MSRKLPQPISKEDFDKLLDCAKSQRDKYWMPRSSRYQPRGKTLQQYLIAMILGFGSGMRISEIVGLDKKYSYVYKGVKKDQSCFIQALTPQQVEANFIRVVGGKGGKDRQVPLPMKIFKRANINRSEFIKNLPLQVSRSSIQKYITELGLKVLNKNISFHKLRHGFVSHALNSGVPIHQVQMFAGHSRMDTTGIYAHADPKQALEDIGKVEW